MKSQYLLIASIMIIVILSYLLNSLLILNNNNNYQFFITAKNFENEIYYIKNNFGYKYIYNYTILFENYTKDLGYNFSFICYSYTNLNLPECNNNKKIDCCYYYNNSYILLPNKAILYYYEDLICFQYNLSFKSNFYSNFFCT